MTIDGSVTIDMPRPYNGVLYRVSFIPDENCESPREWDNVSTIYCWHNSYTLGDKHDYPSPSAFEEEHQGEVEQGKIFLRKLRAYEHGSISLSMDNSYPYNDRWDSYDIGYIWCTLEKAAEEAGIELQPGDTIANCSPEIREKVNRWFEGELKTYNAWINGNCWGWAVESVALCGECGHEIVKTIDSCWGYIVDDNKQMDYIISEAVGSIAADGDLSGEDRETITNHIKGELGWHM